MTKDETPLAVFSGPALRRRALWTGFVIGLCISAVFIAWLWVANQMPQYDAEASLRNLAAGIVTILLMAIPVLRFLHQPVTMFVSGLTAWIILTLTYSMAELRYTLLATRMGALQVFMLGAVCYGFVAVFQWVIQLVLAARHRYRLEDRVPLPPRRSQ